MGTESVHLGDHDVHLFHEGTHRRAYRKLGAHLGRRGAEAGATFAVWAPNAERVSVVGEQNDWRPGAHPLTKRGTSGLWEGFIPGAKHGQKYKYHIRSRDNGYTVAKADPFGCYHEVAPDTASVLWSLDYDWQDAEWMATRAGRQTLAAPISIYEVHLGSWMRVPEDENRSLSYREIAPKLTDHVRRLGYTHVELLPVMEHPFFGSWGYQVTGYFAPSSRYGTPQDFMFLIDYFHRHGIGVILDWVPAHFPTDEHGLGYFDGTHLFEHADPRKGFHPDWNSFIFNYDRNEVRSFLISSAIFWLDVYHADGLRVDGVASMLYLDYSRPEGQWIPNQFGGRENLGAIEFLRQLNESVRDEYPEVQTIAEESTVWPMLTRPCHLGGLGFGLKWDMGWMHDTLQFLRRDPIHRKWHMTELTFRSLYQFHENFMLPLSHDEVVHGKSSLVGKLAGDNWQKLANLRLLYAYQWAMPGKKMSFMGAELAQWDEWNHDTSLAWHLAEDPRHQGIIQLITRLNELYRSEPALHELDCDSYGYEWVTSDTEQCVYVFARRDQSGRRVLVVMNCTPRPRHNWRLGVDVAGDWRELLNTDAKEYGGSGIGNFGRARAAAVACHGQPFSLELTLPPLAVLYLQSASATLSSANG